MAARNFDSPAYMPLKFAGQDIKIYGGPYYDRPAHMFGIKLAKEINLPCNIDLPILDFSIPKPKETKIALMECIKALRQGKEVYVGCMGGRGRTGLYMALLAKAAGVKNPIEYVRSTYTHHAVETPEQEKFVNNFNVFWLRWAYRLSTLRTSAPVVAPFKAF